MRLSVDGCLGVQLEVRVLRRFYTLHNGLILRSGAVCTLHHALWRFVVVELVSFLSEE